MHPTAEVLRQPYLKNFWISPKNRVYADPLVFQVEAHHSTAEEPMHATLTAAQELVPSTTLS